MKPQWLETDKIFFNEMKKTIKNIHFEVQEKGDDKKREPLKTEETDKFKDQNSIDFDINLTIETDIENLFELDTERVKFSFDIPKEVKETMVFKVTLIGWKIIDLLEII